MPTLEAENIGQVPDITFASTSFAEKTESKNYSEEFAEIVEGIAKQIDKSSLLLLTCETLIEFCKLREEVFPLFVKLSRASSNIALAALSQLEISRMVQRTLKETKKEIETIGHDYLSDDDYREALFAISTLQSAQKLIPRLAELPPTNEEEDRKLAGQYFHVTVWARMHIHCLHIAIEKSLPINHEILQELLCSARMSVMAYAYARAALDLRGIIEEKYNNAPEEIIWDEEDEAWVNS